MKLLDVVAMLQGLPEQHLAKGQVGTIVEELDSKHVFVEFSDFDGIAYAITPVPQALLMELKDAPTLGESAW